MSLTTYFWDGLTTGDATQAPYSSAEFALFLSGLLTAEVSGYGYIIPTGFAAFKTTPSTPAAMTVENGAGIIWVDGRLFREPNAQTLTIAPSDPTNPRIDRIIIRIDKTAQKACRHRHRRIGVQRVVVPAQTVDQRRLRQRRQIAD